MNQKKFKAGDVVKCMNSDYELVVGEIYRVTRYSKCGTEVYVVDKYGVESGSWMESRFELVSTKMTIEEKIAIAESWVGKKVQHKTEKSYKGVVDKWDIIKKGKSSSGSVNEQAEKDGYAIAIYYNGFVTPIEKLELVVEVPDKLVLNNKYTATIWNDKVEVGCQTFSKEIIEELYKKLQARQ